MKDFDRWKEDFPSALVAIKPPTDVFADVPDLLRPVEDLREDYNQRVRNLYPADPAVPRAKWDEEIERIMRLPVLPGEYVSSALWQNARLLHLQIRAMEGDHTVTIWFPA